MCDFVEKKRKQNKKILQAKRVQLKRPFSSLLIRDIFVYVLDNSHPPASFWLINKHWFANSHDICKARAHFLLSSVAEKIHRQYKMKINLRSNEIKVNKRVIFKKCEFTEVLQLLCVCDLLKIVLGQRLYDVNSFSSFFFFLNAWCHCMSALSLWSKGRQIHFKYKQMKHKTEIWIHDRLAQMRRKKKRMLWFLVVIRIIGNQTEEERKKKETVLLSIAFVQTGRIKQVEWK